VARSRRPLVLCADDYALSPGVSRGIIEALAAARLSATSVLTTSDDWPAQARMLRPFQTTVDLGLHLNLTLGVPLGAMVRLAPSGQLPKLRDLVFAALLRRLPEQELRSEINRQIDAFETAMGQPPDFIDGHQHVQILPGIRRWLMDELRRRGLARRVWLRNSADSTWKIAARRIGASKAWLVARLGMGFAALARDQGFPFNDGFAGFSEFDPARDYGDDFRNYLKFPGRRHVVMCHPGHVDRALLTLDPVTQAREQELTFLLSRRFGDALDAANLVLMRFGAREAAVPGDPPPLNRR
jgi:chitin disaccharide deacetylase